MILRHSFSPPDNARLAHVCGSFDEHLRSVEAALDVRISRRDANLRIEGAKARAQAAVAVLDGLYVRARKHLSAEQVQLALVEAQSSLHRKATPADSHDESSPNRGAPTNSPTSPSSPALSLGVSAASAGDDIVLHTRRPDLAGRTPNQIAYLRAILGHDISFGIGPAGTGKTFLAVACAIDALERSQVQRIVLTRPAVEAGERLGFLPGDLAQKVDPYLRPLYDALYDLMGLERVTRAFEKGTIEVAPLAFMRGRTLNNAFVILDEAQNTTPEQMKMFLTRIGFGAKAVVTGDVSQIDLPRGALSGLVDAERVLRGVRGIATTYFTSADVVRHPLVARVVEAYDKARAGHA